MSMLEMRKQLANHIGMGFIYGRDSIYPIYLTQNFSTQLSIRRVKKLRVKRQCRPFSTQKILTLEFLLIEKKIVIGVSLYLSKALKGVQRLNEDLFKKIYQNLKNSDIIEYVTNDLRVSRKIITTSERDMRLTLKYIRENIDEEDMMPYVFPLNFNQPILEQGKGQKVYECN